MGEFENIEINRIFDILKSKKLVIVFIIILFTLLGYVYSYYYVTPEYKSTSTLLLTSEEDTVTTTSDLNLNSGLISTYSNIAKDSRVLKQVINNLNLNMTEKQLQNKISVSVIKNTYVIEIAVRDTNAEQAMNITKELSNVFLKEIKQIYNLENIGIVDEAQLPISPYNINHIKDIALFFAIGIFISFAAIIIIYIFDNTIKKEEDIEKYIKVKALGTVPINENKTEELVNKHSAKSYITEHINTIRTNILYMNSTKHHKTVLVTSCTPQEGKSWISANIAVSFAETDKKVLLIDADMRKGRSHKIFNIDNKAGLSNYLYSMTGDIKKDVKLIKEYVDETQIPNLHILTNGSIPPNPSELLNSSSMKELINIFKNIYDIIIIDAPPCKLVTDSVILSTIVDSTVLVANSEKTKISDLTETKKSIQNVGGEIIGAILNKVKVTEKTYSKGYYYVHSEDSYEVKEKSIITVEELVNEALKMIKEKRFNISKENIFEDVQEEHINETQDSNIDKIIKKQNQYLKKVADTMADIKVQLNSNAIKAELKDRNDKSKIEKMFNDKFEKMQQNNANEFKNLQKQTSKDFEELKEISSIEFKDLQILQENNNKELKKIQEKNSLDLKELQKLQESNTSELKEIQMKNNLEIDNFKKVNTNELNELKESILQRTVTKEQIHEMLIEEVNKNNIATNAEIQSILLNISKENIKKEELEAILVDANKVNITKEQLQEILLDANKSNITKEQLQEILVDANKSNITKEELQEILVDANKANITKEQLQEMIVDVNKSNITKEQIEEILSANLTKEQIQDILINTSKTNITKEEIQEMLVEEINKNIITKDQIREILIEEFNKNNNNISEIAQTIKEDRELINIDDIKEVLLEENSKNNLYIEQIKEVFREEINRNTTRIEQIRGILQEEITNITYSNQINKLYSEIADMKNNYKQMQNVLEQELANIDYTEQIERMNEMMVNLKDSYLELSNMIRTNNSIETERIDNSNVIHIKTLKQQKEKNRKIGEYSLDEDIPYEDLEKTAICIIPLPNNENNFSEQTYENMM